MRLLTASIGFAGALTLCSCGAIKVSDEGSGPPQTEHSVIELDKSEIVNTKFHMGVGELHVSGGSAKLMEGDFTYTSPSRKPTVRYSSTGFRGDLVMEQPSKTGRFSTNSADDKWEVKLNDKVAQDLEFEIGVGVTNADLSTVNIRSLDVKMGVGQLELNLRGKPQKDYNVTIKGGVGEARILLPKDIGVFATASGGIGGVDANGMKQNGNEYVNEAYKKSPVTIRLNIEGGVGGIKLEVE